MQPSRKNGLLPNLRGLLKRLNGETRHPVTDADWKPAQVSIINQEDLEQELGSDWINLDDDRFDL